jgi:hypothetical protein
MMREQRAPANATSRSARGESKRALRNAGLPGHRGGRSDSICAKAHGIATEVSTTGTIRDPAQNRLVETREALSGWLDVAAILDARGELGLTGDVQYFATHLWKALTHSERLAEEFLAFANCQSSPNRENSSCAIGHSKEPAEFAFWRATCARRRQPV